MTTLETLEEVGSNVLLFFLVFGMSATVDIDKLRKQLGNYQALMTGLLLQFVILPFVGFMIVRIFRYPPSVGITLLVVTSSPGGSYSNWWCSLFNAELALSVTMTALSTMLSVIMLPLNLIIYTSGLYSADIVKSLDWFALFLSLFVVIGGISGGLFCSAYFKDSPDKSRLVHKTANRFGNISGICLISYSIFISSSNHKAALWDQEWQFFVGIATPAVIGITIATLMASSFKLDKPERVAVAVESCYQNTGIATSVAVVMFAGDEDMVAEAISVPLFYGMVEAALLAVFCLICWKAGWTKAPADENLCVILATSYECEELEALSQASNIDTVLENLSDSESGADCEEGEGGNLGLSHLKQQQLVFEETEALETAGSNDPLRNPSSGAVVLQKANSQNGVHAKPLPRARANTADGNILARQNNHSPRNRSDTADGALSPQSISEATDSEPGVGRFGKTISLLKARATGYRRAPLPDEDGNGQPISPRRPPSVEQVSAEISNQDRQYKDAASPPAKIVPESTSNSDSIPGYSPPKESESQTASPNATPASGKSID